MDNFLGYKLDKWLPMAPTQGPPLPIFLNIFWPWYEAPAAEFKVSDLIIYPGEVQVGQTVLISCTVTNVGTEAGSYTVKCGVS
ncbi:hypothetical protein ES703_120596 [subsurface metagenome]